MSVVRKAAEIPLRLAARTRAAGNNQWALAMLHELDFITDDWAALRWALGGIATVVRFSAAMRNFAGFLSGIGLASLLSVCAAALLTAFFKYLPSYAEQTRWLPWLILIAIPAVSFAMAVAALWRSRKPVAVGIMACGILFSTHFAMRIVAQQG